VSRKSILITLLVLCGLCGNSTRADVPPDRNASRAELLYTTHCIACHNAQVHWREKRLVTDWNSLQSEVRRWQAIAALAWSNEDIAEVAHYLNRLYYRYPPAGLTRGG
jgi:mono/diheme cytochrome c family protein